MQRTTAIYGNPTISGFNFYENELYTSLKSVMSDLDDIQEIMSDHPNINDKVIDYMSNLPFAIKDTKRITEDIIKLAESMSMEVRDEQAGSGKRRKSKMSRRRRRKSHKSRKSGRHTRHRRTRKR